MCWVSRPSACDAATSSSRVCLRGYRPSCGGSAKRRLPSSRQTRAAAAAGRADRGARAPPGSSYVAACAGTAAPASSAPAERPVAAGAAGVVSLGIVQMGVAVRVRATLLSAGGSRLDAGVARAGLGVLPPQTTRSASRAQWVQHRDAVRVSAHELLLWSRTKRS